MCAVPTPAVSILVMETSRLGSPQVINCTVSTVSGVESSSVMIGWMGPGGGSIMNDSRVTISPTTSSGNNYTRSVRFAYLVEADDGTYICNVSILETTMSDSTDLDNFLSKCIILLTISLARSILAA